MLERALRRCSGLPTRAPAEYGQKAYNAREGIETQKVTRRDFPLLPLGQKAYNAREGIETIYIFVTLLSPRVASESIQCSRGH